MTSVDPISPRRRSHESARILAALVAQVMAATPPGQSREWVLLIEPRLQLGNEIIVPDLAAWRHVEQSGPPEWVCDVVTGNGHTSSTSAYARHGVRVVWRIDPADCVVDVMERRDCGWWSTSHTLQLRAEPFQAIDLDLQSVWVPRH
ncbi:MAG TPA: Uma2 family endonuclease [Thermoanaerobaculia bacterium]|jgi:Uma2 family endonuclease